MWLAVWDEIRRVAGWDNPNSFGYLFHSGSGATLELGVWGTILWWFRTSCKVALLCLRPGRHDVADPETGAVHKVCWKHAGARRHLGRGYIRELRQKGHLYLGERPGKGLSRPRRHVTLKFLQGTAYPPRAVPCLVFLHDACSLVV